MKWCALTAAFVATVVLGVAAWWPSSAHAGALPGDMNGDCTVNSTDIYLVASHYGATRYSLRYVAAYDLNHDGRIGIADIQAVAVWFGTRCA